MSGTSPFNLPRVNNKVSVETEFGRLLQAYLFAKLNAPTTADAALKDVEAALDEANLKDLSVRDQRVIEMLARAPVQYKRGFFVPVVAERPQWSSQLPRSVHAKTWASLARSAGQPIDEFVDELSQKNIEQIERSDSLRAALELFDRRILFLNPVAQSLGETAVSEQQDDAKDALQQRTTEAKSAAATVLQSAFRSLRASESTCKAFVEPLYDDLDDEDDDDDDDKEKKQKKQADRFDDLQQEIANIDSVQCAALLQQSVRSVLAQSQSSSDAKTVLSSVGVQLGDRLLALQFGAQYAPNNSAFNPAVVNLNNAPVQLQQNNAIALEEEQLPSQQTALISKSAVVTDQQTPGASAFGRNPDAVLEETEALEASNKSRSPKMDLWQILVIAFSALLLLVLIIFFTMRAVKRRRKTERARQPPAQIF